jgi:hypothetical protein
MFPCSRPTPHKTKTHSTCHSLSWLFFIAVSASSGRAKVTNPNPRERKGFSRSMITRASSICTSGVHAHEQTFKTRSHTASKRCCSTCPHCWKCEWRSSDDTCPQNSHRGQNASRSTHSVRAQNTAQRGRGSTRACVHARQLLQGNERARDLTFHARLPTKIFLESSGAAAELNSLDCAQTQTGWGVSPSIRSREPPTRCKVCAWMHLSRPSAQMLADVGG